jgi:hypothetical protein
MARADIDIDPARRRITIVVEGELTDGDLLQGYDRVRTLPDFSSEYDELVDLLRADGRQVTADGVRSLARRPPTYSPASRRAVVVPSEMGYGMARMYELIQDGESGQIRVFRNREEAERWLGDPD